MVVDFSKCSQTGGVLCGPWGIAAIPPAMQTQLHLEVTFKGEKVGVTWS